MSEISIRAEGLSKRFRLGTRSLGYNTLRDSIGQLLSTRIRPVREEFTALDDVSFEVEEGEAIGLIGANGAGKSTLLKILSRIIEPTQGRALVRGRVASLLEVGTGFHPELTGRENIYLNGTILGMKRAEIRLKFDEIVDFAGTESFLETPVKRYSSGMYVRLAFAVAAHLTPEILLVDEVLAVGDHAFQRKCLGRMGEVARSGRTVVFVSHNLASIETLCEQSILLRKGRVAASGETSAVVAEYLSERGEAAAWNLENLEERDGTGRARIMKLELLETNVDATLRSLRMFQPFRVRIHYEAIERIESPTFGLCLLTNRGERVFLTHTPEAGLRIGSIHGTGYVDCIIATPNVLPGRYRLEVWITDVYMVSSADHLRMVGSIDVGIDTSMTGSTSLLTYPDRGRVYVTCRWYGPYRSNEGDAADASCSEPSPERGSFRKE